ncbi:uncharacterized protein LOC126811742 [Patella vulgata]|uniref:uncharacterized protein LOC126811742 n=1 Tax=Patella vulgata TaxID=6465 RepID=UPI0021803B20|nr:uncharacterized protein LOC126811742 [Patella vulgata]XP_050393570.1 uncharacterized protein LOC126811742 [Patella vulgata]XP_050393571.1 uncharacterized protein LOC126811742 [Patella vulgata]XP_050393572.1 uncharacterized protein LOC126811742 [Patella vulgata]
MGAYTSSFVVEPNRENAVCRQTDPFKANWITSHAISTELTIAEVERLWLRFQQLGCNQHGILTAETLKDPKLNEDAFTRNILKTFKSRDGSMTFESFLRGLKWCESQDVGTKARAIFKMLNNGGPINKEMFSKIAKRLYQDDTQENVKRITDIFFKQMGADVKGVLEEEQFVNGVKKLPRDTLENILNFHILPEETRDGVYKNLPEFKGENNNSISRLSMPTPLPGHRPITMSPFDKIPSDGVLREIAEKIHRRDWDMVANRLGFFTNDVENYRKIYPGNSKEQVLEMFKDWKARDGQQARSQVLERALRDAGMVDASLLLAP